MYQIHIIGSHKFSVQISLYVNQNFFEGHNQGALVLFFQQYPYSICGSPHAAIKGSLITMITIVNEPETKGYVTSSKSTRNWELGLYIHVSKKTMK